MSQIMSPKPERGTCSGCRKRKFDPASFLWDPSRTRPFDRTHSSQEVWPKVKFTSPACRVRATRNPIDREARRSGHWPPAFGIEHHICPARNRERLLFTAGAGGWWLQRAADPGRDQVASLDTEIQTSVIPLEATSSATSKQKQFYESTSDGKVHPFVLRHWSL
jgi:hypothetical protein